MEGRDKREAVLKAIMRRRHSERRVILAALDRLRRPDREVSRDTAIAMAQEIVLAVDRADRKSRVNARSDHDRRLLVGARIRREEGEKYRDQAKEMGISLYQWCQDAFKGHYRYISCGMDLWDELQRRPDQE